MIKTLRRKTTADLRLHWKQFLAVWLVVVLGVAFYGAMYPSGIGLKDSIYRTYQQLNFMDYQIKLAPASWRAVSKLRLIPGLAAVEGRLVVESGVQLDPQRDTLTTLRLVSLPDDGAPAVNQVDVHTGRPAQDDMEILLLQRFAERHGIQPGDELRVWINGQHYHLRVAGLVFSPEYLVAGRSREIPFPATSSFGVAWMSYSRLAGLARMGGQINEIVMRLENSPPTAAQDAAARQAIRQSLAGYDDVEIFSRVQTASGGVIDANVNGNFPVLITFSLLFLAGGLAITGVLLGRIVQSERQRIGTLRALGVTRAELVIHYLSFGALIGVSGGLVGSALGYLNSFVVMMPFVTTIAGSYLPGFTNRPQWSFILAGFAVVVLGTTLAGAYPAWVESGTPPGVALRPPAPRTPSALSRLPLGFLPLALRQALRNLLRVPGRSLGTLLGVMAGSVMVFSAIAILSTLNSSFDSYYASGQFDLRLLTDRLQPGRSLEEDIRSTAGVQGVQAALYGPATVSSAARAEFNTLALALDETQPFLELEGLDGPAAFSSAEGVWIGSNLARVLHVGVGDTISLKAMDETRQAKVLGIVSQVMGSPVFVPRSLVVDWMPGRTYLANAALIRVAPGQKDAVREALAAIPGVISVEDYAAFVGDLRAYVAYWQQTTLIFFLFGCLLTLVVILNTVSATLHEQQSDLAILRSLGVSQGEIAAGVLLDLLIMAGLGIALGVPLGREIGFYLTRAYDTDFYGMIPAVQPVFYWLGSAVMLLLVLLAALPGLRAVQKIDLGQVSKSQSI
jgi:putative ABC transport system permease protein